MNNPKQKIIEWTQNGVFGWVTLNRVRNSFLAKALTALSISSCVVANVPEFLAKIGFHVGGFKFVFFGSLIFLLGYIVTSWRMPPEFGGGPDIVTVVSNMLKIQDFNFFQSRLDLAKRLVERMEAKRPFDMSKHLLDWAKGQQTSASAVTVCTYTSSAPTLYRSELTLRQYDRPIWRAFAWVLLIVGVLFMLVPTLSNVAHILL